MAMTAATSGLGNLAFPVIDVVFNPIFICSTSMDNINSIGTYNVPSLPLTYSLCKILLTMSQCKM